MRPGWRRLAWMEGHVWHYVVCRAVAHVKHKWGSATTAHARVLADHARMQLWALQGVAGRIAPGLVPCP